jgi:hypothetical protein
VKYNGTVCDYTEERMIAGKHEHWSAAIALDKNSKAFYNRGAGVE